MSRVQRLVALTLGLAATACGRSQDVAPVGVAPPPPLAVPDPAAAPAVPAKPAGGRKRPDDPVEYSLRWLASKQRPDGSWNAEGAQADSPADDVSATALALLAFVSAGYTHRSDGPSGDAVRAGFRWLRTAQDDEGRFRPTNRPGSARHDVLATVAFVDAYGMTGSLPYRAPTQRALDALAASGTARPPSDARSSPFALEAFGWSVRALGTAHEIARLDAKAGKDSSLRVDDAVLAPARAWLDAARPAATDDSQLVATRILVRCAMGYGGEDLAALRQDVFLLAGRAAPAEAEADLSNHIAAIGQWASFRAGHDGVSAWEPRGRAWLEAAGRWRTDASGARGSYDERGPLATRTGAVEATAFGSMAELPSCTAYLPEFPGTEAPSDPDADAKLAPAPLDGPRPAGDDPGAPRNR